MPAVNRQPRGGAPACLAIGVRCANARRAVNRRHSQQGAHHQARRRKTQNTTLTCKTQGTRARGKCRRACHLPAAAVAAAAKRSVVRGLMSDDQRWAHHHHHHRHFRKWWKSLSTIQSLKLFSPSSRPVCSQQHPIAAALTMTHLSWPLRHYCRSSGSQQEAHRHAPARPLPSAPRHRSRARRRPTVASAVR